ncbi:hypothetical protein [Planctomycetes bacterium K23_9]|uniref:Uncharacterized protein n=1 Tax=Stieleria marina TaxID=1930275 RepID=A0A517NQR8_9BACT|nr:hypothetical protein K239x_14150 [Planctomycetes bacterium K23_9]
MIQSLTNTMKYRMRRAVTLIEVIFSVGVVLVGLLGLLSVLPLAGRRADDSISLNSGAALAESVFDELVAHKFMSNGQLRRFDYTTVTSAVDSNSSFIIDPMFCSGYEQSEGNLTTTTLPATPNGYDQKAFPYYKQIHHPYIDPLSGSSSTWPALQPRMDRVGIASPFSSPTIPVDGSGDPIGPAFVDVEQALRIVESPDDLWIVRPSDRSQPATFKALQGTSGGLAYGKRVPDSVFSWVATVNPLPDGAYASVSVVIIKDRERSFVAPQINTGANSVEDNALGERVAYINYASGFRGGAGGVVHLNSSTATVSRVRSNDWVMLSRNTGTETFHRWYRVVGIDGKATEIQQPDPVNPTNNIVVWQHKALLDGPDWIFGHEDDASAGSRALALANNTYVTLVQGVVSVTERTILLSDL